MEGNATGRLCEGPEGGPGSKEEETKEYFGRQEWWDC